MTELKPVIIKEDSTGKSYYFDKHTFFKIAYRPWGKDDFYLSSPTSHFFASNKKYCPIEIYTDNKLDKYIMSLHFDKAFPFINKAEPHKVIWSALNFGTSSFGMERNLTWLKDGKEVIKLELSRPVFSEERLFFSGSLTENHLELFASLLYVFFYYQPDNG